MDEKKLLKFLSQIEKDGIIPLYAKGYQWLKSDFLPYLELAEQLLPNEGMLLADCWYLLGDVFDFNAAPLKAIEYYKKAIAADEQIDGAYREIAGMYELVGRYSEALEYINIALELVPDNEQMMDEKAAIVDCINYTTEPFLTPDNQAWDLSERLANDDFDAVISTVAQIENPPINILQCLARAYAAKGNNKAYLETWRQIEAKEGIFELDYGDWFYMPLSIYNGQEIWQLLKSLSSRIEVSTFVYFDSLIEHYGMDLTETEQMNLICDFQIYKASSNFAAIKELAVLYPLWQELVLYNRN